MIEGGPGFSQAGSVGVGGCLAGMAETCMSRRCGHLST